MSDDSANVRASLRDVARAAGVSVATVSRVLNTPEKVSKKTRERVEAKIAELRFLPNAAARIFSTGRTRAVGALVPTLDNAIFARVLDSLEDCLGERGLSLVVATTCDDPDVEFKKANDLLKIGAEALIVIGVTRSPAFNGLIDTARLPVVAISYFDPDYSLPTIGYDNGEGARIALRHLLDLGHRNISVIHGPADTNDRTRARMAAIQDAASGANLTFHETEISVGGGCEAALQLAQAGLQADACLCLSDVIASGVLLEFLRQGIRVPDQISVTGIDDLPSSAFTQPPLTTVHLPVATMGRKAGTAIADWLDTGRAPTPMSLPVSLVERQSTGRPSR